MNVCQKGQFKIKSGNTDKIMAKRKTLQGKLNIEQHESRQKWGMNSGAEGGSAIHAPIMTPVVLPLLE